MASASTTSLETLRQRKLLEENFDTGKLAGDLIGEWRTRVGDRATTVEPNNTAPQTDEGRTYSEGLKNDAGPSASSTPAPPHSSSTGVPVPPSVSVSISSAFSPEFEKQRAHIKKHIYELVSITYLLPGTIAYLEGGGVLGEGDVSHLDGIQDQMAKNKEFYKIIRNKQGIYEILIEAMEEGKQTGVADLLKKWNSYS